MVETIHGSVGVGALDGRGTIVNGIERLGAIARASFPAPEHREEPRCEQVSGAYATQEDAIDALFCAFPAALPVMVWAIEQGKVNGLRYGYCSRNAFALHARCAIGWIMTVYAIEDINEIRNAAVGAGWAVEDSVIGCSSCTQETCPNLATLHAALMALAQGDSYRELWQQERSEPKVRARRILIAAQAALPAAMLS